MVRLVSLFRVHRASFRGVVAFRPEVLAIGVLKLWVL